jgi:hypothetical protein
MTAALAYGDLLCWGTNASIEDILSRAATLSAETLAPSAPVSVLLAEEYTSYWGGKVVEFKMTGDSLKQLAALLESARELAIASRTFTEMGVGWLSGSLADFCRQLQVASRNDRD